MASQTDLDQGNTWRHWGLQFLGPSIGWVYGPAQNILNVNAAGTYNVDASTNVVEVNSGGAVILNLPKAANPSGGGQPGLLVDPSILIVDVGGNTNGTTNTITINPQAGETIMGLGLLARGRLFLRGYASRQCEDQEEGACTFHFLGGNTLARRSRLSFGQ